MTFSVTRMDVSFNAFTGQYENQGGWGGGDHSFNATQMPNVQATQAPTARNEWEKFPLPATVALLNTMEEGSEQLKVGKYTFNQVRVIGQVLQVNDNQSSVEYVIKDVNGSPDLIFTLLQYISLDGVTKSQILAEDSIIFATGRLRNFDSVPTLLVYHIYQVTDSAQISCFAKEARFSELYFAKDLPNRVNEIGPQANAALISAQPPASNSRQTNSNARPGFAMPDNAQAAKPRGTYQNAAHPDIQNQQQQRIYEYIASINDESGANITMIRTAARADPNFQNDLDHLASIGVIYNTIDDNHFAVVSDT